MTRWTRLANALTQRAGSNLAFVLAILLAGIWAVIGVIAGPSRTWELSVTCGVPILTLLMVIVLQHSQNRDTKAVELKLNELVLALEGTDSQVIHAHRLGEAKLQELDAQHAERALTPAEDLPAVDEVSTARP